MGEKLSIHYIMAHEKIRDLIFEEWEKTNLLLNKGPDMLKQYFCKLWADTKQEVEYVDDIDIVDLNRAIKPDDFDITYSNLDNGMKTFNFIMPKPLNDYGQVVYLSLVITKEIPRLFTLELGKKINEGDCYFLGEWKIDFESNDYMHKNYGTIEEPIIGKFLGRINEIVNLKQ